MTKDTFKTIMEHLLNNDIQRAIVILDTAKSNGMYSTSQSRISVSRDEYIMFDTYVHFKLNDGDNPFDSARTSWVNFMVPYENIKMICA